MEEDTSKGCGTIILIIIAAVILFFGFRDNKKQKENLKNLSEELDRANRYKVTDLYVVDNIDGRKEIIVDTTKNKETRGLYYYDPNTKLFYCLMGNNGKDDNKLTHEDGVTAELSLNSLDPFGLYVKDNGQIYYTEDELTSIEEQINENDSVRKIG